MARTEVQQAERKVLAAVDTWFDAHHDREISYPEFKTHVLVMFDAVEELRAARARQDVRTREVYLRTDATESERQAAQAAMLARGGWRLYVYEALTAQPMSDRLVEVHAHEARHYVSHTVYIAGHKIVVPDRRVTHQTLSSARKSLVDVGLVVEHGAEIFEGRRHIIWRAVPQLEVSDDGS